MVFKRSTLLSASFEKFKEMLNEEKRGYNSLASLRSFLSKQESITPVTLNKIRFVQRKMNDCLAQGKVTRRRVPGTGERVTVDKEYKDTPENRKRNRVGQTYQRTVYENAEYLDHRQQKMRRKRVKRSDEDVSDGIEYVRRNFWIEAMAIAKRNLGAPAFVVVRKEIDDQADETQILGYKVYVEARRVLEELRKEDETLRAELDQQYAELKKHAEQTKAFDPEWVDLVVKAAGTRALRKLVAQYGMGLYKCVRAIQEKEDWRPLAAEYQEELAERARQAALPKEPKEPKEAKQPKQGAKEDAKGAASKRQRAPRKQAGIATEAVSEAVSEAAPAEKKKRAPRKARETTAAVQQEQQEQQEQKEQEPAMPRRHKRPTRRASTTKTLEEAPQTAFNLVTA